MELPTSRDATGLAAAALSVEELGSDDAHEVSMEDLIGKTPAPCLN